jgi:hypothetical protein
MRHRLGFGTAVSSKNKYIFSNAKQIPDQDMSPIFLPFHFACVSFPLSSQELKGEKAGQSTFSVLGKFLGQLLRGLGAHVDSHALILFTFAATTSNIHALTFSTVPSIPAKKHSARKTLFTNHI